MTATARRTATRRDGTSGCDDLVVDAPSSTEERSEVVEALLLDLLQWVVSPRPYHDVMEAWRTSCPRLPVWEEATRRGFVRLQRAAGQPAFVVLTPAGLAHLAGS
jgi:D-3-phosphoglycerate dehydrogenase / 2-oxoglutarate reductase